MRVAGRLVAAWLVLAGVLLGAGWLLTGPLAASVGGWDDEAARAIADQRTPALGSVADVGTVLADTPVGTAVAAIGAAALAWWRRSWVPVVFVAVVLAGTGGLYRLGTWLIERDRPPVRILDPGLVPDHSYPSGHVFTAIGAYLGLALLIGWLAPRARPWVWSLGLVPLLVAASRLYEGAHHVSDVLVTAAIGLAWLAVAGTTLLRGRARP